jgi:hypothetical protein
VSLLRRCTDYGLGYRYAIVRYRRERKVYVLPTYTKLSDTKRYRQLTHSVTGHTSVTGQPAGLMIHEE